MGHNVCPESCLENSNKKIKPWHKLCLNGDFEKI